MTVRWGSAAQCGLRPDVGSNIQNADIVRATSKGAMMTAAVA